MRSSRSLPGRAREKLSLLLTFVICSLLGLGVALPAKGDLVINTIGVAVVENFNSFTGLGFSPTPSAGQLDSNTWRVSGLSDGSLNYGDTGTTGDFARGASAGGVTTGGVYGFLVATGDRALGIQPVEEDFTPGFFEVRVLNNTGSTVGTWDISYDIYVRNDQGRSNSFNFSFSTDGSAFTAVPALNFASPEAADASPAWVSTPRSTSLAATVAHGGNLFLRWTGNDVSGAGARDEFALDNVSVTGTPEPSTMALAAVAAVVAAAVCLRRRVSVTSRASPSGAIAG